MENCGICYEDIDDKNSGNCDKCRGKCCVNCWERMFYDDRYDKMMRDGKWSIRCCYCRDLT